MARYRKPFTLIKRGQVWFYRTYDEYGRRTTKRSTGQTNKTLAERYCFELARKGELVPAKRTLFSAYAADWWTWDRCGYVRGKLARSSTDKPAISRRHVDDMHKVLEAHVLPTFKDRRLEDISAPAVERWMFELRDKGLSPKRVNNVTGCLRVMLREAKRQGLIARDPFDVVRPFADNSKERGIFTIEEVRKLFAAGSIEEVWQGHLLYRAINELAAATGMRQGEILAVRDEDVRDGYIHVAHSWAIGYGLGPTKTRQVRDVPVPARVLEDLAPFRGTGGYVFSFNRGRAPATGNRITEHLYGALERVGIPEAQRKARNLTFHSWRHFFNSVMRARAVPAAVLQRVTGHATAAMTERYTHFRLEDFADVAAVQGEVFADA